MDPKKLTKVIARLSRCSDTQLKDVAHNFYFLTRGFSADDIQDLAHALLREAEKRGLTDPPRFGKNPCGGPVFETKDYKVIASLKTGQVYQAFAKNGVQYDFKLLSASPRTYLVMWADNQRQVRHAELGTYFRFTRNPLSDFVPRSVRTLAVKLTKKLRVGTPSGGFKKACRYCGMFRSDGAVPVERCAAYKKVVAQHGSALLERWTRHPLLANACALFVPGKHDNPLTVTEKGALLKSAAEHRADAQQHASAVAQAFDLGNASGLEDAALKNPRDNKGFWRPHHKTWGDYVAFLENTLVPDLEESKSGYAEDFARIARLLSDDQDDPRFQAWLRDTLLPDTRETYGRTGGMTESLMDGLYWLAYRQSVRFAKERLYPDNRKNPPGFRKGDRVRDVFGKEHVVVSVRGTSLETMVRSGKGWLPSRVHIGKASRLGNPLNRKELGTTLREAKRSLDDARQAKREGAKRSAIFFAGKAEGIAQTAARRAEPRFRGGNALGDVVIRTYMEANKVARGRDGSMMDPLHRNPAQVRPPVPGAHLIAPDALAMEYRDVPKAKREGVNDPNRPWRHDFSRRGTRVWGLPDRRYVLLEGRQPLWRRQKNTRTGK